MRAPSLFLDKLLWGRVRRVHNRGTLDTREKAQRMLVPGRARASPVLPPPGCCCGLLLHIVELPERAKKLNDQDAWELLKQLNLLHKAAKSAARGRRGPTKRK